MRASSLLAALDAKRYVWLTALTASSSAGTGNSLLLLEPCQRRVQVPALWLGCFPLPVCHQHCALLLQTLTKGGVTYRDEPWHKECFVCTGCKTPLAGQQFTSQDDNPYCIKCFGNLYAKKCSACTKPITGEHISSQWSGGYFCPFVCVFSSPY